MEPNQQRVRRWLVTAAIPVGVAIGAAGIAAAATGGSSTNSSAGNATPSAPNGAVNPEQMTNGPGETLLTGTTADQVKAAALAAVPGATVIRVETDSAGSPYEAHLEKSDGTDVTVKVSADFKATATENGFGNHPAGRGPDGAAPNAQAQQSGGAA
ncbi:MAG: hypothetical protein U0V73_06020 [Acidimicrobiia bacterium]